MSWPFYELSLGSAGRFIGSTGQCRCFILAGQMEQVSTVERFLPLFTSMFLHGGWLHLEAMCFYL
jgi:membrane associated rhomboid family serine protease